MNHPYHNVLRCQIGEIHSIFFRWRKNFRKVSHRYTSSSFLEWWSGEQAMTHDVRLSSLAPAGRRTLVRSPTISYFFSCPTPAPSQILWGQKGREKILWYLVKSSRLSWLPSFFSFLFSFLFFLCLLLFKSVLPGSKCVACFMWNGWIKATLAISGSSCIFLSDRVVENQKRFRKNPEFASVHNKVFRLEIVGKYCRYQTNWKFFWTKSQIVECCFMTTKSKYEDILGLATQSYSCSI